VAPLPEFNAYALPPQSVVRNFGLEFRIQHSISEDVRGLNFLGAKQAAEKLVGAVILSEAKNLCICRIRQMRRSFLRFTQDRLRLLRMTALAVFPHPAKCSITQSSDQTIARLHDLPIPLGPVTHFPVSVIGGFDSRDEGNWVAYGEPHASSPGSLRSPPPPLEAVSKLGGARCSAALGATIRLCSGDVLIAGRRWGYRRYRSFETASLGEGCSITRWANDMMIRSPISRSPDSQSEILVVKDLARREDQTASG
jgi:hypothetical protein